MRVIEANAAASPVIEGRSLVDWSTSGKELDQVVGIIGSLEWIVYDGASWVVLGQGRRLLYPEDVVTKHGVAQDGRPYLTRHIALSDGFRLGLPTFPAARPDDITGFGLTAEYERERTFSWDWFTIDAPGRARKLQEDGRLGFGLGHDEMGWSVARLEFLTEVSLRVLPLVAGVDPTNPKWRVNILPGSYLHLPL